MVEGRFSLDGNLEQRLYVYFFAFVLWFHDFKYISNSTRETQVEVWNKMKLYTMVTYFIHSMIDIPIVCPPLQMNTAGTTLCYYYHYF